MPVIPIVTRLIPSSSSFGLAIWRCVEYCQLLVRSLSIICATITSARGRLRASIWSWSMIVNHQGRQLCCGLLFGRRVAGPSGRLGAGAAIASSAFIIGQLAERHRGRGLWAGRFFAVMVDLPRLAFWDDSGQASILGAGT